MKVYLASSFSLASDVDYISRYLEDRGHLVLVKWWAADGFNMHDKKSDSTHPDAFYNDPVCKMIYERDFDGVRDADVFILVAGATPKAFNGANVEYGLALACGKPCFAIGSLENCALYYPIVRCTKLHELAEKMEATEQ